MKRTKLSAKRGEMKLVTRGSSLATRLRTDRAHEQSQTSGFFQVDTSLNFTAFRLALVNRGVTPVITRELGT